MHSRVMLILLVGDPTLKTAALESNRVQLPVSQDCGVADHEREQE